MRERKVEAIAPEVSRLSTVPSEMARARKRTGEISGKPERMTDQREYTITAKNEGGSTEIKVKTTLTTRKISF